MLNASQANVPQATAPARAPAQKTPYQELRVRVESGRRVSDAALGHFLARLTMETDACTCEGAELGSSSNEIDFTGKA